MAICIGNWETPLSQGSFLQLKTEQLLVGNGCRHVPLGRIVAFGPCFSCGDRLFATQCGSACCHHFSNKEMLVRALYLEGRNSLNAALSSCINTESPREGIEAIVRAYLSWIEEHPDLGQYVVQAGNSEYLSAYVKVLRQKTRTMLPTGNFADQLQQWLEPHISDGSIASLLRSLYLPLIIGPSREFLRRWLRSREPAEIEEAREPLARAAWTVLVARRSE